MNLRKLKQQWTQRTSDSTYNKQFKKSIYNITYIDFFYAQNFD